MSEVQWKYTNALGRHIVAFTACKHAQHFEYPTRERWFLSYGVLDAIFKYSKNPVYYSMPSQVNQNAVKTAVKSWTDFFKSLKDYKTSPIKYVEKPKEPHYIKDSEATAWFTNQVAKIKEVSNKTILTFVNCDEILPICKITEKYVKTEVKPCFGGYKILITTKYDDGGVEEVEVPKDATKFMGIDVGVDNLAAVTNNVGKEPFIIKGTAVKSHNQWFNKRKSMLISDRTKGLDSTHSEKNSHALYALSRKRSEFLRDYFYKTAHYICRLAKGYGIEVIIIGHNKGQKQEINIGKANNQNFVSIPFNMFIAFLRFTAWKYGIALVEREESYTSKASFLNMDDIPTYKQGDDTKYTFSGKRVYRGLYKTKDGIIINADVNGSANIIRKEYPDAFKGMNLEYMYKSLTIVDFKDLYKKSKPKRAFNKHRVNKPRKHKQGPCSHIRRNERWDEKIALMRTFDAGKKIFIKKEKEQKTA